jgi:hypothetical protein
VNRNLLVSLPLAVTVGLGALLTTGSALAMNFGDMMNPGRWFGGDNDRYDDRYYGGRYGNYGPYGGWGGPYGGGWGGPYGGGPWGGYYAPYGGGWGGYPGYAPGSTIVVTPQTGDSSPQQVTPRLPE